MKKFLPIKYKLKCPVCKGNFFKIRFELSQNKILQCTYCGLGLLEPFPKEQELTNFYESSYFLSKNLHGYANYLTFRNEFEKEAERRLTEINKYVNVSASLLDVGAGLGSFANCSKKFGYKTEVLDISSFALKYIKKTYKINGYKGDLSRYFELRKTFKVITAWDVIEHVRDLDLCLRSICGSLENGGYLFLSTPNLDSWDARLLGKKWYGFTKIPEHVFYLTPKSLKIVAQRNNFNILSISQSGFYRSFGFVAEKLFVSYPCLIIQY